MPHNAILFKIFMGNGEREQKEKKKDVSKVHTGKKTKKKKTTLL